MKDIILGHKVERDELLRQGFVLREGIEEARKSLDTNLIKVIIGPRRAGKSVFALQLLQGVDFAYLNFDDERFVRISDYDDILKAIIQVYGNTHYLLFDEIQNLERWELLVNRLQRRGYNLVLTGSNSRLLSTGLASHLTGRYLQFQVLPFSLFISGTPPQDTALEIDAGWNLLSLRINEKKSIDDLISGNEDKIMSV